jgi:hypothetical protein
MLIPILSAALGSMIFMALGFSFTEMESIGAIAQTRLVVVAAFTVAFGSTFGSVGSGIEVFSKSYKAQARVWDWIALGVSGLTTVAGFGMGFAALLGATAEWSALAQVYGSLVVGTLAALDSTCDMIELGGLFGSFELRTERWLEEKRQHETRHGISKPLPPARIADFERVLGRLNGERADLNEEQLEAELAADGKGLPSASTVGRWLKMVQQ